MRYLIALLAVLAVAGWAYAEGPIDMRVGEEVTVPTPDLEFYCQPPHVNLQTLNACTGFGSEVVDDIPDEYYCMNIGDIVFYVSQWAGAWVTPSGVNINIYYSECPPGLTPDATYYFSWGEMETEIIFDDPGNFTTYRCKVYLPEPLHIEYDMSIGFQVVTTWGDGVPYTGVVLTDDNAVFGCGQGYMDPTYWGYPRWSLIGDLLGVSYDVAYCLSEVVECTGGDLGFIACLSDCEETVYKWNIIAGTCAVNDMEICVYDPDTGNPVPVEICSHPLDWTCGYNGGPHCVYFETTTHPVLAGETYGPFDFGILGVYDVLEVVWTFTYDGIIVAGPDTTFFICGASSNDPSSWGGIKALYR
jgi:hypothetical protein